VDHLDIALARADALEATGNLMAAADVLANALSCCHNPTLQASPALQALIAFRIDAARDASADHTRQSLHTPFLTALGGTTLDGTTLDGTIGGARHLKTERLP
jgi:hypothetical protein